MKIKETKNSVVCTWSRKTESDLTWRKVREYCNSQIEKLLSSNEAKEVEACKTFISILQKRIDNFEKRVNMYRKMSNSIKDTDRDIDIPFGESQPQSDISE